MSHKVKYRHLTTEEMEQFEKEFIDYLVVNGITADSWEKMKQDEPDKANHISWLFADVVFEKILRNCQFLLFRSEGNIQAIQCLQDKMILVAITATNSEVNLESCDLSSLKVDQVQFVKGEKKYQEVREIELFKMTEQGYQISDGTVFKQLMLASISN